MAIKGWKNAHSDLARIRREARAEAKRFAVVGVNKNGQLSKIPPNPDYDLFEHRDQAEKRKASLEEMNPGRKWEVVDRLALDRPISK